jgi:hypothetical protein
MTDFLISNSKDEKNKKSSSEPSETSEPSEPPELQIGYVQSYERLTSFRRTMVKNRKILLISPETSEPPVTHVALQYYSPLPNGGEENA